MNEDQLLINQSQSKVNYFKEIMRYRELFYFFAWRDVLVRYKQAFFGIAWALVRPLLNMLVFTLLFGKMANLSSSNVNYSLFVLAAMLPWQLFASSISDTCTSLVNNSALVSKVYFPRMIIPMAQIIVNLLDFAITLGLLLILGVYFGGFNFLTMLTLPLFLLLSLMLCMGMGLWLSAITVQYRDFRIIVPFFVQFGMFISPVGYGTFVIPEQWQWLYFLNPLAGIIDGFRWALFGISYPNMLFSIGCSIVMTAVVLSSGITYFRKTERSFADKI